MAFECERERATIQFAIKKRTKGNLTKLSPIHIYLLSGFIHTTAKFVVFIWPFVKVVAGKQFTISVKNKVPPEINRRKLIVEGANWPRSHRAPIKTKTFRHFAFKSRMKWFCITHIAPIRSDDKIEIVYCAGCIGRIDIARVYIEFLFPIAFECRSKWW